MKGGKKMKSKVKLEPIEIFNKWSALECLADSSRVVATSQFFHPLDVSYYIELIKKGENALVSTEIWPSGYCNHHCIFCSSDIFGLKDKSMLNERTLKELISDLAILGNKIVRFSGGGEPFLIKGMENIIELIAKRNMLSSFITNGSVLQESTLNMVTEYASVFRVSFNAGNENDYLLVHRADNFNKVICNMQNIASERVKKKRENSLLLGATFVVTPQNFRSVNNAARIVKNCGFDFFFIRGLNPIRYRFTGADRDTLYDQIRKSHALKDARFFISGSIEKLDGARGKKKLCPTCYATNYRTYIDYNGDVFPCFSGIMHKGRSYGNIYETSIRKIWQGEQHLQLRNDLEKGFLPNFCNRFCSYVEFNTFVKWIKEKVSSNKEVKFKRIPRSWADEFISEEYKLWF